MTYKEVNEAGMAQFEVQRLFESIQSAEDDKERARLGEIALKGITDLTMRLVAKSIEYVKTPDSVVTEKEYILDFLQNCDKNIYIEARDYNTKLKQKTELKPLDITCVECGNKYDQPFTLNTSDFFA